MGAISRRFYGVDASKRLDRERCPGGCRKPSNQEGSRVEAGISMSECSFVKLLVKMKGAECSEVVLSCDSPTHMRCGLCGVRGSTHVRKA